MENSEYERSMGNRLATYPNSKIFWEYW